MRGAAAMRDLIPSQGSGQPGLRAAIGQGPARAQGSHRRNALAPVMLHLRSVSQVDAAVRRVGCGPGSGNGRCPACLSLNILLSVYS